MRARSAVVLCLIVAGSIVGCGGGDSEEERSPEATAEQFIAAIRDDDTEGACSLVDEDYIEGLDQGYSDAFDYFVETSKPTADDCPALVENLASERRSIPDELTTEPTENNDGDDRAIYVDYGDAITATVRVHVGPGGEWLVTGAAFP